MKKSVVKILLSMMLILPSFVGADQVKGLIVLVSSS